MKYVQGGIGKDEADAMLKQARNYPLTVVFSGGRDNNFLASIDVRVPRCVRYVVDAAHRNDTLTRSTELSAKHATRLDFHWPSGD